MNWKLLLVALSLTAFVSCGGGDVKSDAKKICDCLKESEKMATDESKLNEAMEKATECIKISEEVAEKYKDNESKAKELAKEIEDCTK